jgi:hypothetical protein
MAKLTTKKRKSLKSSTFGLPKERKYPMPDRSHAGNAKARAQQQYDKGNISKSTLNKIDAKANKILGKSDSKNSKKKPESSAKKRGRPRKAVHHTRRAS